HVLVLRVLVALDEVVALDELVVGRAEYLLLNPTFALVMYEVEGDGFRSRCRVEFDGNRHQTKGNRARSDCSRSHVAIVAEEFSNCRKVRKSFRRTKPSATEHERTNRSTLNLRIAVLRRSAKRSSCIVTMLAGATGICGSSSAACFAASP